MGAEDKLKEMFEPFYASKGKHGKGLSIARTIVEAHHRADICKTLGPWWCCGYEAEAGSLSVMARLDAPDQSQGTSLLMN